MQRYSVIDDVPSPRIRRLYEYWMTQKGGRAMPSRQDIDPADIPALLPYIIMTRLEYAPFRVRYTLVGTRCVENGAFDYTGHYLDELYFRTEHDTDWHEVYSLLSREKLPILGLCEVKFDNGLLKPYAIAILPLSSNGETVDQTIALEDLELEPLEAMRRPPTIRTGEPRR
ncbi:MAG: PAS domain-containing protein [Rhodospirillaceae bacterium]|nr:MAG: PAS domain-containing protein [Rhodospirillaceae bacterium]